MILGQGLEIWGVVQSIGIWFQGVGSMQSISMVGVRIMIMGHLNVIVITPLQTRNPYRIRKNSNLTDSLRNLTDSVGEFYSYEFYT